MAIEGRDDDALKAIAEIARDEFIFGWQRRLRDNVHFAALRDRSEFVTILKTIAKRNADARTELKQQSGD